MADNPLSSHVDHLPRDNLPLYSPSCQALLLSNRLQLSPSPWFSLSVVWSFQPPSPGLDLGWTDNLLRVLKSLHRYSQLFFSPVLPLNDLKDRALQCARLRSSSHKPEEFFWMYSHVLIGSYPDLPFSKNNIKMIKRKPFYTYRPTHGFYVVA